MSSIEENIEVNVDVRTGYNQWTPEWDAEITEQHPEERIAWANTTGATNKGVVTFHRLDDDRSKVMLQLDFEPEGFVESAGDALGVVKRRAKGDLERFKEFIETRGTESGAWRGDVPRRGAS